MSITLHVDKKAWMNMQLSLQLLALQPARRRRVLRRMGQEVRRRSRKNIRQQRTVEGQAMAPRKSGKKKLLKNMGKGLVVKAKAENVQVSWKKAGVAQVGYRHQHGVKEQFDAGKVVRRYGRPDYNAAATRTQAKSLLKAGFKIYAGKTKGRVRTRRATQGWIMKNLTLGHAGYLIRRLLGKSPARTWTVDVPERPFLGVTAADGTDLMVDALRQERGG